MGSDGRNEAQPRWTNNHSATPRNSQPAGTYNLKLMKSKSPLKFEGGVYTKFLGFALGRLNKKRQNTVATAWAAMGSFVTGKLPKVSRQLRASRKLARSLPSERSSHDSVSLTMAAGRLETPGRREAGLPSRMPTAPVTLTPKLLPAGQNGNQTCRELLAGQPACALRSEQARSQLNASHTVAAHHPCNALVDLSSRGATNDRHMS